MKRLSLITAAVCLSTICLVGCQIPQNGQTLPSPSYGMDDVQYFPSGPEFKLTREAAALQAARAQEKAAR